MKKSWFCKFLLLPVVVTFVIIYIGIWEEKTSEKSKEYKKIPEFPIWMKQQNREAKQTFIIHNVQRTTTQMPTTHHTILNKHDIANIIAVSKKMNVKPLLVTLINGAFLEFALSWLCNTMYMDIHKQVLMISTDRDTKEEIRKLWPDLNVVAISGMHLNESQAYSHAGYVKLTNFRARVLLELLQHKNEILLFEVDALWVNNPIQKISKMEKFDIATNPVSARPGLTAIGFVYLLPTNATIMTWKELNRKLYALDRRIKNKEPGELISEGDNDQIYLSELINKRIGNLQKQTLPLEDFADGKWYNMPVDKQQKSHPFVINNNWVIGKKNKISRAKTWGHWFLNSDRTCNESQIRKITEEGILLFP